MTWTYLDVDSGFDLDSNVAPDSIVDCDLVAARNRRETDQVDLEVDDPVSLEVNDRVNLDVAGRRRRPPRSDHS